MYEKYFGQGKTEIRGRSAFSMWEKLLVLLLFLASVNFINYGLYFMAVLFVVFFMQRRQVYVSIEILPTLLLSVSLLLFWRDSLNGSFGIIKCAVWPMAYIVGNGIAFPKENDRDAYLDVEKKVKVLFSVSAGGFFAHLALNMLINLGEDNLGRNVLDFWTRGIRSSTGQAAIACVPLGFSIASLFGRKPFRQKIMSVIFLITILYFNLILSTRTLFLMAILVAFLALVYSMWGSGNQRRLKTLLMVVFVVGSLIALYYYNIFGVRTTIENSGFYNRFFGDTGQEITEDGRWDRKLAYFPLLTDYLWGGGQIHSIVGHYAHDLFLDTYDEAGVFALVALIMLVWSATVNLVRLIKNDRVDFGLRMSVLCVYAALYMEFMIEPIFAGAPDLLMIFCFFHGLVTHLLSYTKSAYRRE